MGPKINKKRGYHVIVERIELDRIKRNLEDIRELRCDRITELNGGYGGSDICADCELYFKNSGKDYKCLMDTAISALDEILKIGDKEAAKEAAKEFKNWLQ